jgi:excinuclease UvrABC nuclease subunit
MPITGDSFAFTKANVDTSPMTPGVYQLSQDGSVIYIGMSEQTIRSRLQSHQSGAEGACTVKATTYKRETTTAAAARNRESALLSEYRSAHQGKAPSCNKAG